jgi:hypothetical protein
MAIPGSEASHEAKLRELAGDAAELVITGPRKFPPWRVDAIAPLIASGFVCLCVPDPDRRIMVYWHDNRAHAITTDLVHKGYRRRYSKSSATSFADLFDALSQ